MKWLAIIFLQLALLHNQALSGLPKELSEAKYDGFVDDQIIPEEEMLVNRKSDNPESDERLSSDEDDRDDDSDFSSYISNSNNGVNSYTYSSSSSNGHTIVNGIDTSVSSRIYLEVKFLLTDRYNIQKWPANYHKVTTTTKIIDGRPVKVNITIDKKTDPVTGQVSVSVSESSSSSSSSSSASFSRESNTCSPIKPCKPGYFCKLSWIRTCQKCSNINQRCLQNEECCGSGTAGALCVNGMCQVGYRKGDAGTSCQKMTDCTSSMCCARGFMKPFGTCKPLAKTGEKCAPSTSTMSHMIDPGMCPCQRGLICSSGSWTERFFGGSMNTFFSGNTCRVPRRMPFRARRGWWRRRNFW